MSIEKGRTMKGISSMSLAEGLVAQVVEDYLNAQMLKVPHRVRGLEFCEGFVTVELEAVDAPEPLTVVSLAERVMTQVVEERKNGNGHVTAEAPQSGPKRAPSLDSLQKAAIRERVRAQPDRTARSIAEELGLALPTVTSWVTTYRKELAQAPGDGNSRLEAALGAPDAPVQEPFRG